MQTTIRSFDPLRVLSEDERRRQLDAFLGFVTEREGEIDLERRTLARREPRMRAFEQNAVVWTGDVDREGFRRSMQRLPVATLDLRTQWILAAAKANEGERFGIEIELARYRARGSFSGMRSPRLMLYMLMQEAYHCRLLVDICRTCGVEFESREPAVATRFLIAVIGALPGRMRWVPVLAAEMVGTTVFRLLATRLHLFAEQPEVRGHLTACMREIWLDEVLHVAFLRAQLHAPGLAVARALVPVIARETLRDVPQLGTLGVTPHEILESLKGGIEIPEELGWLEADGPSESSIAAPVAGVVG